LNFATNIMKHYKTKYSPRFFLLCWILCLCFMMVLWYFVYCKFGFLYFLLFVIAFCFFIWLQRRWLQRR
jgi:Flp pilus assembly protein TadB